MLINSCGDGASKPASGEGLEPQRYVAVTTVLASPDHGPQLCLGGVATSLPPQCGGPDVVGWDWTEIEGEESVGGTTWGEYRVVGTYQEGGFTLTEPATIAGPEDYPTGEDIDFLTACPEPPGGWTVVDPATATIAGQDAAIAYAQAQADLAGLWLDQSINVELSQTTDPPVIEAVANDPTKLILNVGFTGNLDGHTAELRSRWGGALCVFVRERSLAELEAVQLAIRDRADMLATGTDVIAGSVTLYVIVGDGLQEEMDATYGAGVVEVTAALRPLE